jgi:hypothetical protein
VNYQVIAQKSSVFPGMPPTSDDHDNGPNNIPNNMRKDTTIEALHIFPITIDTANPLVVAAMSQSDYI